MAVSAGNVAQATEYNSLRTIVNQFFGDPNPSMTFGDGSQTYGWGGTVPSIVVAGVDLAEEIDWNALVDRVNIGSDITENVSGNQAQAGALIYASEYNAVENYANGVSADRLNIDAAEMSLNAGGTVVQASSWNSLLRIVVRYTFGSFAEARYFFNSGGAFNVSLSLSGGSTGNALSWANLFTDIGTITMNYTETIMSGSTGTAQALGYYDLTTGYQQLFTASPKGGSSYASYSESYAYSDNDIEINARRSASGDYIELQIICNDDHAGAVDGTTTLTTQYRKLISQASGAASLGILAPAYSLIEQTSA